VREILEAVNSVGRMGSGTQDDKKYAAKFKLEGTSGCFYLSNVELYEEHIRFCKILETRFRFIETDQYHYQRLLEVKQGKGDDDDDDDEDVLSFFDRVKLRARKFCPVREVLQYIIRTNLNERRGSCVSLHMALDQAYRLQCNYRPLRLWREPQKLQIPCI
jgi:hypothetical protein